MTFPTDIFPEDKLDPTAGTKEQEYHVERTLGVIGHVKGIAKKRQWRYLVQEGEKMFSRGAAKIREFYGLPGAPIATQGDTWAIWSGEDEPSSPAFEPLPEPLPEQEPARALAEVLKNAPPGTVLESAQAEILKATDVSDDELRDIAKFPNTWAYSTKTDHLADPASMRARFKTRPDAPIETNGDIAAVWMGEGAPSKAAFPKGMPTTNGIDKNGRLIPVLSGNFSSGGATDGSTCSVCGEPLGSVLRPGFSCMGPFHAKAAPPGITQLTGDPDTRAPDVSPHVPSAALNDMGLKIYKLSRNALFTTGFREYLLQVSDTLHAEAAKIELGKVRAGVDARSVRDGRK